jgi:N-acetylneuraminate synthase
MDNIIKRKRPFLIAEIGINHNGSIKLAKQLIDLAKKYNFDSVKFQKRDPNICVPEEQKSKIRGTPWGEMTYLKYKEKIELGEKEFREIDKYCKKIKIDWFCSPWDKNSLNFMKKFKIKYNKVASAMITNLDLVELIAQEKKLTFISTGMSTMTDINNAVKIFKKNKCDFVLMHCVSTYPCDEKSLNLNLIPVLKRKFKCKIGYSGHETSVSPTYAAWFLGADYIERHITLDRTMYGTDQSASLSEPGIRELTNILSKFSFMLGDGKKIITNEEKKLIPKFRYWKTQ